MNQEFWYVHAMLNCPISSGHIWSCLIDKLCFAAFQTQAQFSGSSYDDAFGIYVFCLCYITLVFHKCLHACTTVPLLSKHLSGFQHVKYLALYVDCGYCSFDDYMSLDLVRFISIMGDTRLLCSQRKSRDIFLCPRYSFLTPINLNGIMFDILLLKFQWSI